MRKVLVMALISVFSLLPLLNARAASGDVWISPPDEVFGPATFFDLAVHVDTGGQKLGAFTIELSFDPELVRVDTSKGDNGVDKGSNAGSYSMVVNGENLPGGPLVFGGIAASGQAVGSDAQIAVVHMQTQSVFSSMTNINLEVINLSNELGADIAVGQVTGTVINPYTDVCSSLCYRDCGNCPQTDATPSGSLDFTDAKTLSGWAYDENKGSNPVTVHIYLDGNFLGQAIANVPRNDLVDSLGSPNHGFSYQLPGALSAGVHSVRVYALNDGNDIHPELMNSPRTFTINAVDNTPPTGALVIDDGGNQTSSQNVVLTIRAEDPAGLDSMKIYNTLDFGGATIFPFSSQMGWNLSTGDGQKTVYLWLKDKLGNWTGAETPISDTINLVTVYPSISAISVSEITQTSARVNWQATDADYCEVLYGLGGNYTQEVSGALAGTAYSAQLSSLSPATAYDYYIRCSNPNSNSSHSQVLSFTTAAAPQADTTAPAIVSDLKAEANGPNSFILSWTAPGDDATSGLASQFDIRYSRTEITPANWDYATHLTDEPAPEAAFVKQRLAVVGLEANTNYYFAMKTADEVPNWSPLSNMIRAKTAHAANSDRIPPGKAKKLTAYPVDTQVLLTWENPTDADFTKSILLRSKKPFATSQTSESLLSIDEAVFQTAAVSGTVTPSGSEGQVSPAEAINTEYEIVYEGNKEYHIDRNLANQTTYYYALISMDAVPNFSAPEFVSATPENLKQVIQVMKQEIVRLQTEYKNLSKLNSKLVDSISYEEAKAIFNYGQYVNLSEEGKTLYDALIAREKLRLSNNMKYALAYFIEYGTPTTEALGKGERAGVLNSFFSAYGKLPRNTSDYQDVIKIANGRWPRQTIRNKEALAEEAFQKIYRRLSDGQTNEHDQAAITIMAYGLRPAVRDLQAESNAIATFRSVYKHDPRTASEWDLVRAIAYSGATR
jgi:hypothetical protein